MNDADIFSAVAPARWTILGLRLRPFSIGHLILLHRINSPFVCEGERLDYHALASAVFICSRTYEDALEGIDDPDLPRAMRKWAKKVTGARWWRRGKSVNLIEKWAEFERYMREGDWTPVFQRDEQRTRKVGLPFVQSVRVKLMDRFRLGDTEVMNRGWALCKADFFTLLDADGVLTIWDDAAQQELARLREQAAEVERRFNSGEMQIKWQ